MPLTEKGRKILKAMQEEYGEAKGKEVFYASINAGKITGAHIKDDEETMDAKPKRKRPIVIEFRMPQRK